MERDLENLLGPIDVTHQSIVQLVEVHDASIRRWRSASAL
jgi:hypothetical protein